MAHDLEKEELRELHSILESNRETGCVEESIDFEDYDRDMESIRNTLSQMNTFAANEEFYITSENLAANIEGSKDSAKIFLERINKSYTNVIENVENPQTYMLEIREKMPENTEVHKMPDDITYIGTPTKYYTPIFLSEQLNQDIINTIKN